MSDSDGREVTPGETDRVVENRADSGMHNPPRSAAGPDSRALRRAQCFLALAGLLAGLVAFAAGEAVYKLIPAELVKVNTMGQIMMAPTEKTARAADVRNAALAFGLLGVCLGSFMGTAGGLARRSASAMARAGVLGAVLGLAAGALISFGLLPIFLDTQPFHPEHELILSVIMHMAIWGVTGAAAGLAFAVGLGERRLVARAIAAGFVGAALGSLVFELVGAALFPLASTGQPISTTWPSRLLARLLVTAASVAGVILTISAPLPAEASESHAIAPTSPS